ncbi:MAG: exodeoxyribonuclease VII small subunit [Candidatus Saccharimonadales bacterium]
MAKNPNNYQTLSAELEAILDKLQDPSIGVDQALKLYEQGQKIAQDLQAYLKTANNRLKNLDTKLTGNGQIGKAK